MAASLAGLLTALELAALDLQGTELAVLSACDTAVGTTEIHDRWGTPTGRADGVYGLRRALILAGAETQLMTLWKVEDRATRQFMAQLYQNLAEGMARSDALRAVQIAAIRKRTPPRAWAAFIMAGVDGPLEAARPIRNKPARRHGCGCSTGGAYAETSGIIGLLALFMLWLIRRTSSRGRSRGCQYTRHRSSLPHPPHPRRETRA
ncbi:MAG: CHAT domain-containing protein [Proteobacteria bacterium]|nr:CHAT domain-containing protein [Pseudomonadota bacterium]